LLETVILAAPGSVPKPNEIQDAVERAGQHVVDVQSAVLHGSPSVSFGFDHSISPHWRVRWKHGDAVGEFGCVCLACPEKDRRIEKLQRRAKEAYAAYQTLRAAFGQHEDDEDDDYR
jgi:hypothetical protein